MTIIHDDVHHVPKWRKWRYGCGKKIKVYVPRGFTYREMTVECGSTAHDGGVNQCGACVNKKRPPPTPEYGDDDFDQDAYNRAEAT